MAYYFDISDVVKYATGHTNVSGIQRVQLNLLRFASVFLDDSYAIYFDPRKRKFFRVRLNALFAGGEVVDLRRLLDALGLRGGGFLPARQDVRKYISKFDNKKTRRGLEKIKVYACSIFARPYLRSIGLLPRQKFSPFVDIAVEAVYELNRTDVLVLLGAFWDYDDVFKFAEFHKKKEGQVVVMLHDLIPISAAKFSTRGLISKFEEVIWRAPAIASDFFAVSKATAQEMEKYLRPAPATISVLGLPHEFCGEPRVTSWNACQLQEDRADLPNYIQQQYVLCVGTIEPRKNGELLLDAWLQLYDVIGEALPDLIFCGKYGWKFRDFEAKLSGNPLLMRKVKIIAGLTDRQLACLYRNAYFCVFPSHCEGWGLPVGEAAWFGQYTLCSGSSSIPEVCGNLNDYLPHDNVEAWVEAIAHLLQNPDEVKKKRIRIMNFDGLITWQQGGERLVRMLKTLRD